MIPLLLIGGAIATIFVGWKAYSSPTIGASQTSGVPAATPTNWAVSGSGFNPAPTGPSAVPGFGVAATGIGLGVASTGLSMASQASQSGQGLFSAGSAIPIAGVAIAAAGAIFGALMAAHAARMKQATDENSAVNIGIQGFDRDVKTVSDAVNAKQLTVAQGIQYLMQVKANYWALVTPKIQPGRNGCAGGANCPGGQIGKRSDAGGGGGCMTGQCKCTGTIGAACCVGCNMVNGAIANLIALYQSGKSGGANVCQVFASKYGGADRAGYVVNYVA